VSNEVPEPWASAMIAANLTDPRYTRPVPSRRKLAEAADTTTSTVSAMIAGTRDTNGSIVQRVAEALGMGDQADVVARWVGLARTQAKPFVPHRDADLLTAEEQEAVNEIIRLMALAKKGGLRAPRLPQIPAAATDGAGDVDETYLPKMPPDIQREVAESKRPRRKQAEAPDRSA
jgi:hypothetical protein